MSPPVARARRIAGATSARPAAWPLPGAGPTEQLVVQQPDDQTGHEGVPGTDSVDDVDGSGRLDVSSPVAARHANTVAAERHDHEGGAESCPPP